MEENGDIVNVGTEGKKDGKEEVKWVMFEERKLVEDKGIQFDIQRSVEKVGENKEKGNNEGDDKGNGNVEGGNNNNEKNDVKDNNVPVVVEENKQQQQQQQEVQVNNVNGDKNSNNNNVNEQQQSNQQQQIQDNNNVNSNGNEQQQQQQQQPQTTPLSSSEVFNILNEINFEMDTISNNLTTTLNFDPDKSIKNLITQVNSLHPDNPDTIQKTTQNVKHIEDRGTQPSYIMYPSSSQKTLSLTTPHPHPHHHHHHKPKKHTHKKTQMTALYQGIDITIPRTTPLHRKPIIYMQSESSSHNPTHTRTLPTHKHSSHPYHENIPTINTAIDILTEHH